ncbi:NUDIX domain-containing protein [Amycolatopsis sp.]|uniref:NUDIX hydrolase n=1 Tax=Amycolatopsis sp. TaxID=37632 RepID=UPI002628C436|nr:NUDIX domain-containing protein [Amycolatopsis sp.]
MEPLENRTSGTQRCVGGIVYDDHGSLLLIKRRNDPGRGLWSVPGGRVEPGETDAEAVVRELAEETGLVVTPSTLVGRVVRGRYEIFDYACTAVGGTLRAGDDAEDARWVDLADFTRLDQSGALVEELADNLRDWDVLPKR